MSTHKELLYSDIAENHARFKLYSSSSPLPAREMYQNRPKRPKYRRDRVLHEIINRDMQYKMSQIIDMVNGGGSGKDA